MDKDFDVDQNKALGIAGIAVLAVGVLALTMTGSTGQTASPQENQPESPQTGQSQQEQQQTSTPGSAGSTAAVKVVSATADVTVEMENIKFQSSPQIQAGTVVKFVNRDQYAHTVTIKSAEINKRVAAGESVKLAFSESGTYQVVCTLHPGMATTVTVA
ncbi:MAG: cupredoxin domain-containing protein [Candidatus Nanohaloarchaea archaeon]